MGPEEKIKVSLLGPDDSADIDEIAGVGGGGVFERDGI